MKGQTVNKVDRLFSGSGALSNRGASTSSLFLEPMLSVGRFPESDGTVQQLLDFI
jgi:hypothetical protein